jgi:hypothetical protein
MAGGIHQRLRAGGRRGGGVGHPCGQLGGHRTQFGHAGSVPVDWGKLRRLADQQCDLLTRWQCLEAGLSEGTLRWRIDSGRWVRRLPGVFLTKPGRADWGVSAMSALLWAQGPEAAAGAAFSGRSAAHLWGLERNPPEVVELVVPYARTIAEPEGVRIRRSMRWDGLVDTAQLRQEIVARGGHRYSKLLLPALCDVEDGLQSGAELLYIRDVEGAHGLPRAARQAPSDVGRRRHHDNEYEAYGLIVEVDGRLGHELWSDRVRDGRRDRQLLSEKRVTTRVFFADVAVTPCQTATDIGAILTSRGWPGTLRRCPRRGCPVAGRRTAVPVGPASRSL